MKDTDTNQDYQYAPVQLPKVPAMAARWAQALSITAIKYPQAFGAMGSEKVQEAEDYFFKA